MNQSAHHAHTNRTLVRLIAVTVVLAIVAAVVYRVGQANVDQPDHRATMISTGLALKVENRLDARFTDANNDLVADTPGDAAALVDPDVLTFSYIATDEPAKYATVFAPFVEHLAGRTGKKVEYVLIESFKDQLKALKAGSLHVTGLNTGNVPIAVNACGFVPVATPGNGEGVLGYKMQLVVPKASAVTSVADLKGKTIAFTDPASNSGYKAALVILMSDFGLEPERDYLWVFSRGHVESILGVAGGHYEAAAVASDMISRSVGRGEVSEDAVKVVYSSELFPTAAVGYLCTLKPELAEKVKTAIFDFDWKATALESEFAASGVDRFVPVSYKDDFALVRRIDDAVGFKHVVE